MNITAAHRSSMMFSAQIFNVLFPLSCSTTIACWHILRREHKLSQGKSSVEMLHFFICVSPKTVLPVKSSQQLDHLCLWENNGRQMLLRAAPKRIFQLFQSSVHEYIHGCTGSILKTASNQKKQSFDLKYLFFNQNCLICVT